MASARRLSAIALALTACGTRAAPTTTAAATECVKDADCTPLPCAHRRCQSGGCVLGDALRETAAAVDAPGDCRTVTCDENGSPRATESAQDVPTDEGDVCTDEVCVEGFPRHQPKSSATSCPGGVCTLAGGCVRFDRIFAGMSPSAYFCGQSSDHELICRGGMVRSDEAVQSARIRVAEGIVDVAIARANACVLDRKGVVSCWGSAPGLGVPFARGSSLVLPDRRVEIAVATGAAAIVSSWDFTCARLPTGAVRCWNGGAKTWSTPPNFDATRDLSVGGNMVCAVSKAGDGVCTRLDFRAAAPPVVTVVEHALHASNGDFYACFMLENHDVACARSLKGHSIVGDAMPVAVTGAVRMAAVTNGGCVANAAGDVTCWRAASEGAPVPRPDLGHAVSFTSNGSSVCVLDDGGHIRCTALADVAPGNSDDMTL